jgi:mono/diheme cytochrome c family protein
MKIRLILFVSAFILVSAIITSCQDEASLNFKRYYSTGSTVYQSSCQNCHGVNGEGLGALIPPLTDSLYLRVNLNKLPCLIKNGISGNITVKGKPYAQAMPPQTELTPIQVAEVITYIGNSFGNKIGLVDVDKINADFAKCN